MQQASIPATTGYFNAGDIFVILAGLWLGPIAGCTVGVLGPTATDAIGYPQFMLATAVTKGLEGLLVGGGHKASLGRTFVQAPVRCRKGGFGVNSFEVT